MLYRKFNQLKFSKFSINVLRMIQEIFQDLFDEKRLNWSNHFFKFHDIFWPQGGAATKRTAYWNYQICTHTHKWQHNEKTHTDQLMAEAPLCLGNKEGW